MRRRKHGNSVISESPHRANTCDKQYQFYSMAASPISSARTLRRAPLQDRGGRSTAVEMTTRLTVVRSTLFVHQLSNPIANFYDVINLRFTGCRLALAGDDEGSARYATYMPASRGKCPRTPDRCRDEWPARHAGFPLRLVRDRQLQQQLFDQLRDLIVSSRLQPGSRMPSSRMLAEQFAISRMTVLLTYERLIAEGYLETRPAAGPSSRNASSIRLPGAWRSMHRPSLWPTHRRNIGPASGHRRLMSASARPDVQAECPRRRCRPVAVPGAALALIVASRAGPHRRTVRNRAPMWKPGLARRHRELAVHLTRSSSIRRAGHAGERAATGIARGGSSRIASLRGPACACSVLRAD